MPYKLSIDSSRASCLIRSTVFKLSVLDTTACSGVEKVPGILFVCSSLPFTLKWRSRTFPLIRPIILAKHSGKSLKKEQRFRFTIGQPRFVVIEIGRYTFRSWAQNNGLIRRAGLKYSRMWHVAIWQLSKENCCYFQIWKICRKSKIDAAGCGVREVEN